MRIVGSLVLVILAILLGFGLLTSFEPGVHWMWRIGYGSGCLLCLAGAVWIGMGSSRKS
ncbi:MAG: hypothetical protein IT435_00295 [Phycisphaerales bacterium]|nr:hypothetical protein [Phycisphaerales bacterium]